MATHCDNNESLQSQRQKPIHVRNVIVVSSSRRREKRQPHTRATATTDATANATNATQQSSAVECVSVHTQTTESFMDSSRSFVHPVTLWCRIEELRIENDVLRSDLLRAQNTFEDRMAASRDEVREQRRDATCQLQYALLQRQRAASSESSSSGGDDDDDSDTDDIVVSD